MPKGSGKMYTSKHIDVAGRPRFGQPSSRRAASRTSGKANRMSAMAKRKY